jgi:hypothetical protein
MSVELREFVKQTLLDILKGVTDVQADPSIGKNVAPWGIGGAKHPGKAVATTPSGPLISVAFDVAVTAESTDSARGGAGFKVAVMGIGASVGAEADAAARNVAVTRIQFEVPLLLPAADRPSN